MCEGGADGFRAQIISFSGSKIDKGSNSEGNGVIEAILCWYILHFLAFSCSHSHVWLLLLSSSPSRFSSSHTALIPSSFSSSSSSSSNSSSSLPPLLGLSLAHARMLAGGA